MTLAAAAASERTETTTTVDDLHRASSEAKDTIPDSNNVIANTHDAPVPTKDGPITPRKRPWYHPKSLFQLALDNWFLIGIFVFIIIASQAPSVAKTGGHIRAEITVSWVGLAIIFLITGLTLSTPALLSNLSNFYLHFLTQIISLIVFPTVVFVIITIIRSVQNTPIDRFILIGYMVAGVMPTTVASNIAMTRTAKGNVEAATAEVCVGQILGIFFSPLLLEMFLLADTWSFGRPVASGSGGSGGRSESLKEIYRQLGKKMGLALFLPLVVGQVVRYFFLEKTKWFAAKFHLAKIASFILLLVIWAAFSNQFATDAFSTVSGASIAMTVVLNLVLYLFFTAMCIFVARPPFLRKSSRPKISAVIKRLTFDKKTTTAICFCAAAKGLVVAYPVLEILYGGYDARERAIVSIPMVLYQGSQVAVAQLLTYLFRIWNEKPDPYAEDLEDEKAARPQVA